MVKYWLCTVPAKDAFATATRMIKPECLVYTCVDQVFLYL